VTRVSASRLAAVAAILLAVSACAPRDKRTHLYVQRFFGECGAVYGRQTDLAKAEGECGIMTTLINRFNAENPDLRVEVNVVAWPGYPQLAAQIAARDPPDLVTMHQSVISDYQSRGLLEPMDAVLREAGVAPASFTAASRRGVTKAGAMYGLPWDTVGGLFHVNTRLFALAGLMKNGRPIFPRSPSELIAQARQFRRATGKPYFVQSQVNDPATHVRNLYTYLFAQDAVIFPDARHIRLRTPEARRVVQLFRTIEAEGLTTHNQDYPAAVASFIKGEGGVFPVGTWMIGAFDQEAGTPGRPLYRSYAVFPYPRLFGHDAAFVDGHSWVMPKRKRSRAQAHAIARFLRFMAGHNFDWSRTGHIPAVAAVVRSAQFQALPHRRDIAPLAAFGSPLPYYVRRQAPIEGTIGEELASAISGAKPIDQALADAERRVNELLAQSD
jgi:multiple sugar transport system substrate-binding protein